MMDKSCHSSGEESSAINPNLDSSSNKDQYLKQIHKLSHKISKPPIRKPFEFDHHLHQNHQIHQTPVVLDESQPSNLHHNQQQHQPPVYNVSKSDFRDVVQKLTGSPAHEKPASFAPPVKPQTSRLHKIRPPPLEHIGNRPPSSVGGLIPANPAFRPVTGSFFTGQRPLSPLPPLPTVHAAAESPISAYMRCFQTNFTGVTPPTQSQLPPLNSLPLPDFPAPGSPLPFGCLPPMLSPTNRFGFQRRTPLSPTPPAASPRWKSV